MALSKRTIPANPTSLELRWDSVACLPGFPYGYVPYLGSTCEDKFVFYMEDFLLTLFNTEIKVCCRNAQPRSLYTSSPTSDKAARQGLGGQQGLIVIAVCIAVVAAVTFLGKEGPQTLSQVCDPCRCSAANIAQTSAGRRVRTLVLCPRRISGSMICPCGTEKTWTMRTMHYNAWPP